MGWYPFYNHWQSRSSLSERSRAAPSSGMATRFTDDTANLKHPSENTFGPVLVGGRPGLAAPAVKILGSAPPAARSSTSYKVLIAWRSRPFSRLRHSPGCRDEGRMLCRLWWGSPAESVERMPSHGRWDFRIVTSSRASSSTRASLHWKCLGGGFGFLSGSGSGKGVAWRSPAAPWRQTQIPPSDSGSWSASPASRGPGYRRSVCRGSCFNCASAAGDR
jgi:hypothetical protein